MRPFILLFTIVTACGSPPSKSENAVSNNGPSNVVANNQDGCTDPAPGCGVCEAPSCEDGTWVCLGTPCPNPGCADPEPDCATECPAAGGVANCVERNWECTCDEACAPVSSSTLTGVWIDIDPGRCQWTLAEAAAGIAIGYTVHVTQEHEIVPTSQQNGCDEPGPSGLRQQESVRGDDQLYCICDVGLCQDEPITVALVPGDYTFAMAWDGVNWTGPSDFGNPRGEPFPPGEYEVQVRATGTVGEQVYEVLATLPITLVE